MEDQEVDILLGKWLAGTLTGEEKSQLKQAGSLDELRVVVDDIASWSVGELDIEGGLAHLKQMQLVGKRSAIRRKMWYSIAASLALCLMIAGLWLMRQTGDIQLETGIAEVQEFHLPDGSLMKLDATSQANYNTNDWTTERNVYLAGQAYFDVTSGSPFQVQTSSGIISVLGTRFNVKAKGDRFQVECYEGQVQVQTSTDQDIISAGEKIRLIKGKLQKQSHSRTTPDWASKMSIYEEAPLSEVVEDLSSYFELDIQLPDQYADLAFSGQVSQIDERQALRSIFVPMGIDYSLEDNGKVLIR